MALRDLNNNVLARQSLAPAQRTAAVNGAGVDTKGFDSAMAVIDAGAIGGTSPSFTFELQESDDNSSFTAVADADLDGTEPVLTAGGQVVQLGYSGAKQYLRIAITAASGTSPTLFCAGAIVLGHAHQTPTQ